jgi:hypothetical protein
MNLKNKFKQSGIKQFLDEIKNSTNVYKSYGNHLCIYNEQIDLNVIKDKTTVINFLRKKKFPLEKNFSW